VVQLNPSLPIPIMLISDAPECLTGLARIGRDLAALLSTLPQFRVAYLGRGGVGRAKFPWAQYSFPESAQWGEEYLEPCWNDFRNGQSGIIMSCWDPSRMLWFGTSRVPGYPQLERFLGAGRSFQKWGYFPIDSVGVRDNVVPSIASATLAGYDRTLAASQWGRNVSGAEDWLPHGLWMDTFKTAIDYYPGGQYTWRKAIESGWDLNTVVLGCNMANQSRKDWPVAFETAALLKAQYGNDFRFWAHTDTPLRYWNLQALAFEYGVNDCTEITLELTDSQLAARYAACDCTILPSAGEGFGYPIAESLACGTACIVTDYAAGAELVDPAHRAAPMAYRIDTQHNVRRAVLSAYSFANRAKQQIEAKRADWVGASERNRAQVEHLGWEKLKHEWTKWFLKGIGQ
jgi:glycosyltransferase involved in cell wall biosynthesis